MPAPSHLPASPPTQVVRASRPRDAASLILVRRDPDEAPRVLLGRREPRSSFMPSVFVFPGGRLDRADWRCTPGSPLHERTAARLAHHCDPARATSLAVAALRETREETGLRTAAPASGDAPPELDGLYYLGRAITPASSPIRYHARFFVADHARFGGTLRSNGELLDLAWYRIEEALELPIIDVTLAMLQEVQRLLLQARPGSATAPPPGPLFIRYRNQIAHVSRDGDDVGAAFE